MIVDAWSYSLMLQMIDKTNRVLGSKKKDYLIKIIVYCYHIFSSGPNVITLNGFFYYQKVTRTTRCDCSIGWMSFGWPIYFTFL